MANTNIPIDVDYLRANFDYDPNTGNISFKNTNDGIDPRELNTGNVVIKVTGMDETRKYPEIVGGRFAWAYQTGEDPGEYEIVYRNHYAADLAFSNLRKTTARGRCIHNVAIPGIFPQTDDGKFTVKLARKVIGHFDTITKAQAVLRAAKEVMLAAIDVDADPDEALLEYRRVLTSTQSVLQSDSTAPLPDSNEIS